MSVFWQLFKSKVSKNGDELVPISVMDYLEQLREQMAETIEGLSQDFWDRVEDKEGCDICGAPKTKSDGWGYYEKDYKLSTAKGKVEVKENDRKLYCSDCTKSPKPKK